MQSRQHQELLFRKKSRILRIPSVLCSHFLNDWDTCSSWHVVPEIKTLLILERRKIYFDYWCNPVHWRQSKVAIIPDGWRRAKMAHQAQIVSAILLVDESGNSGFPIGQNLLSVPIGLEYSAYRNLLISTGDFLCVSHLFDLVLCVIHSWIIHTEAGTTLYTFYNGNATCIPGTHYFALIFWASRRCRLHSGLSLEFYTILY